ncbi:MAG: glycosyltransferase family 4 protein [Planctomycetota bacterium]
MRVIVVSCVFPPEPMTSATTSADVAVGLSRAGHEVTVIAPFPSRPAGILYNGFRRSFRKVCVEPEGYRLLRTFSTISARSVVSSRFLENISFGICAAVNSAAVRADVVYLNTWPVFASGLFALQAAVRRLPLVVSVQDIYPEAIIEQGKLSANSIAVAALRRIDQWVAHRATKLVTISENFAEFYRSHRGVPKEKIEVVPNWMNDDVIVPGPRNGSFRQRMNIAESAFVVMYVGNVGATADIANSIEAAALISNERQIVFVIAGDGALRSMYEESVRQRGLDNIKFVYPLPQQEFCDVQAAADVMLLPMRKGGAFASVPSKLVAYMLSGRPVLAAVDSQSDTARFIRDADCGQIVSPENPTELVAAIRKFSSRRGDLEMMGLRARAYAQQHFTVRACVPKLVKIIETAARR